jgi:hypothetical protein
LAPDRALKRCQEKQPAGIGPRGLCFAVRRPKIMAAEKSITKILLLTEIFIAL